MPSAAPAAPASYYPPVGRAAGQGPGLAGLTASRAQPRSGPGDPYECRPYAAQRGGGSLEERTGARAAGLRPRRSLESAAHRVESRACLGTLLGAGRSQVPLPCAEAQKGMASERL